MHCSSSSCSSAIYGLDIFSHIISINYCLPPIYEEMKCHTHLNFTRQGVLIYSLLQLQRQHLIFPNILLISADHLEINDKSVSLGLQKVDVFFCLTLLSQTLKSNPQCDDIQKQQLRTLRRCDYGAEPSEWTSALIRLHNLAQQPKNLLHQASGDS